MSVLCLWLDLPSEEQEAAPQEARETTQKDIQERFFLTNHPECDIILLHSAALKYLSNTSQETRQKETQMRSLRLIGLSILSFLFLSLPALAGPSPGDKITDFAINKLNGLFDAVKTALPTVTKYTLQVTSLGCTVNLLTGLAFTIFSGATGYIVYRLVKFTHEKTNEGRSSNYIDYFPMIFVSLVGAILPIVLFIVGMVYLLDFWSWICVAHPDAYLIHLAVQRVVH